MSGDYVMSEYISDVIIGSVHDVFLAFVDMEVFPGFVTERVTARPDELHPVEMTVIVGFSGAINGGLRFSCSLSVALALAGSLLEQMFTSVCSEVKDALVQLANGIARSVQSNVSLLGIQREEIHLTPPVVVSGSQHSFSYGKCATSVKQTFQVDAGPFFVECFYLDISSEPTVLS